MATPLNTRINEMLHAGMTIDEIQTRVHAQRGDDFHTYWDDIDGVTVQIISAPNRRTVDAFERVYAAWTTTGRTNRPANAATDRQVAFIMRLIADGEYGWYNGPRDIAGVRNLTKRQASTYIDALLGR